ncbi:MAG: SDR family oxidoreductase [Flavobacterium sp.]
MRVFVTGASGFVGSAIVNELLSAGHSVLGLVRSQESAGKLESTGAQALSGDINDVKLIAEAAAACDAVIHTAFNHDDFTRFRQNCEDDRLVVQALANALIGTDKPLVVTSGIGILKKVGIATEDDVNPGSDIMPRAATEEAVIAAQVKGVNAYIVRLPPSTHGEGDRGFVPMIAAIAKEKRKSAYIDDGKNLWPAVHRFDAAKIYRLIVEKQPEQKVFHAVAEQGMSFRDIAVAIGNKLCLTTESLAQDDVEGHFGWFSHFAAMDCEASAEMTKQALGWQPQQTGLLDDIKANYFN